jgi:uncharacterized coiled-coil protein SlyX
VKKLLPWIALALVSILAFLAVRSCGGPDERYWVAKATYNRAVADAAAKLDAALGTIALQEGTITAANAAIAEKEAKVAQYVGKVSTLTAELRALQNSEPAQPELETQPLVINLRAQIGNLTESLSINARVIAEKDGIIADWSAKFDAQAIISETWKAAYEREHRLRLSAEDLNISLEHQAKSIRLFGKVSMATLAGAGVYLLLKK